MAVIRLRNIMTAAAAILFIPVTPALADDTKCEWKPGAMGCGGEATEEGVFNPVRKKLPGPPVPDGPVDPKPQRPVGPVGDRFPLPAPGLEFIALCPHPDDPKREIECRNFGGGETPTPIKFVARPIDDSGPPRPVTIEEFKNFPVAKGEIVLQPDQGHHTVNLPVVAATTARQHVVSAEILGYPFHVRFTPISHTFDYGDTTTPMTTSDPNTLYPNNRFWHEWSRTGTFTISITTTWSGAYQVAGSAWINVDGTLNTTVSSEPQQVNEYHILLKHPDTPDGPGTPGTPGNPGNLGMPDHQPGTPGNSAPPGTPGDTITPPDPKRKHSPLQP